MYYTSLIGTLIFMNFTYYYFNKSKQFKNEN